MSAAESTFPSQCKIREKTPAANGAYTTEEASMVVAQVLRRGYSYGSDGGGAYYRKNVGRGKKRDDRSHLLRFVDLDLGAGALDGRFLEEAWEGAFILRGGMRQPLSKPMRSSRWALMRASLTKS